MCPRLEHLLTIAALIQALMRMLWRLKTNNQRWRIYDHFLVGENRWRAQRYGVTEGLIDFGRGAVVPFEDLVEEMIDLLTEDAVALGSLNEIRGARDILQIGTSAARQRAVYQAASASGADTQAAMRAVLTSLIEEFAADI